MWYAGTVSGQTVGEGNAVRASDEGYVFTAIENSEILLWQEWLLLAEDNGNYRLYPAVSMSLIAISASSRFHFDWNASTTFHPAFSKAWRRSR